MTRVVGRPERRLVRAAAPQGAVEGLVDDTRDRGILLARPRRDVHVVEKAAAQAQLVDQRQREGVDVGNPHGTSLGVLGRVGERRHLVLGVGVEGLDPPPDPVAVGLDDGDVVARLFQQQPGGQPCNAGTHDEHVAGPPRFGQAVVDQDLQVLQLQVLPSGTDQEHGSRCAEACLPPSGVEDGRLDGQAGSRDSREGYRLACGAGRGGPGGQSAAQCGHGREQTEGF